MINKNDHTEKALTIELMVTLSKWLKQSLQADGHEIAELGYGYHLYTSSLEDGCEILWKFGCALAAFTNHRDLKRETITENVGFPPYFKPLAEAEVRNILTNKLTDNVPELNQVLSAYVQNATEFGGECRRLSDESTPFPLPTDCGEEIDLLVTHGYLEQSNSMLKWTSKISRIMQEAHIWSENDQPIMINR